MDGWDKHEVQRMINKSFKEFMEEFEKNLKAKIDSTLPQTVAKDAVGAISCVVLEALKETRENF